MKKLSYLFLLFIILLSSCSKEEKDSAADYQVLGITSITINGLQIPVINGTLLDVSNIRAITIDAVENNVAKKQIQMSYIVFAETGSSLSIKLESSYATTSVVVTEEEKTDYTTYKVIVTREGYKEQITYVFQNVEKAYP